MLGGGGVRLKPPWPDPPVLDTCSWGGPDPPPSACQLLVGGSGPLPQQLAGFLKWLASDDARRTSSLHQVAMGVRTFNAQTRLVDWSTDAEIADLMGQLLVQAAGTSNDE